MHLGKLQKHPRTGNPELSKGLQTVAKTLKPHSNKLLKELADTLPGNFKSAANKVKPQKPKVELPPNLKSLNSDAIDAILDNQQRYASLF